jgi:hypothetical protein
MFCLARQIRQSADFAMNIGGRLAENLHKSRHPSQTAPELSP